MLETGFYQQDFGRKGKSKLLEAPKQCDRSVGPQSRTGQGHHSSISFVEIGTSFVPEPLRLTGS